MLVGREDGVEDVFDLQPNKPTTETKTKTQSSEKTSAFCCWNDRYYLAPVNDKSSALQVGNILHSEGRKEKLEHE